MVRPLLTAIALGTLVLASGIVGCDSLSRADILPAKETTDLAFRCEFAGRILLPATRAADSPHRLFSAAAPASKAANSSSFAALEQSVHQQINRYRKSRNLPPLTLDPRISEQARAHSQAMARGRVPFSHQGFEQRVQAIRRVIPYRAAAENVAFNKGYRNPGQQAVQGWIKSPGHRKNIVGHYNRTGVGIAKNAKGEYYFTQLFILRR